MLIIVFMVSFTNAKNYKVDKLNSSISFKIKCMIIGSVHGEFKRFSGHFKMQENKLKAFNVTCYTNSIHTRNSKRDRDLKSTYFFHVKKYPIMKLKMLKRKDNKILIRITIKGITKDIYFDYRPNIKFVNLRKKHRVAFILTGKIKLKDFNLDLRSTIGKKSIVLGKIVSILANIEGYDESF